MRIKSMKYFKKKQLKYRNKSSCCRQNHWHPSYKEANWCDNLALLKKAGEIKDYETQVKFDLKVKGQKIAGIIVDFLITNRDGTKVVEEVKSYITMTPLWNIKRKLFEALYPKIPYNVIK